MKTICLISKFLNLKDLNKFMKELANNKNEDNLILDVSGISFCDPKSILSLAVLLRKFQSDRKHLKTNVIFEGASNVGGYLEHIGFFDFIGINRGKKMGQALGGKTYIPIRKLLKRDLLSLEFETGESMQDLIEFESASLARVLVGEGRNKQDYLAIAFSIREAIRNALEHSQEDVCYVCAQRYSTGRAQIAVIDEGIGIYQSLINANIDITYNNFLKEALKPGLTRVMQLSDSENIHGNSGFGLYILYYLAKNYGNFILSSSGKTIEITKGSLMAEESITNLNGTLISIEFLGYPHNMHDMLKMISDAGEQEALDEGRVVKASSRSRSVTL